jgi:CTP:molybdopterin cytidylyltransferase MocA
MGSLKPLLPLGGKPAVTWAAETLLAAGVNDIVVVVGHSGKEVASAVEHLPIQIAFNEDFTSGMFSSVLRGLEAISPESDAFFVMPADIPLVAPNTIRNLADTLFSSPMELDVVYPRYSGRRGHPPLISARLTDQVRSWTGDGGLRGFLERRQPRALDVDVDDPGILMDMDTPEDYVRLVEYFDGRFQGKLSGGASYADQL